MKFLHILQYFC